MLIIGVLGIDRWFFSSILATPRPFPLSVRSLLLHRYDFSAKHFQGLSTARAPNHYVKPSHSAAPFGSDYGYRGWVQRMYRPCSGIHFWVSYEWSEPFSVLKKKFRGAPQNFKNNERFGSLVWNPKVGPWTRSVRSRYILCSLILPCPKIIILFGTAYFFQRLNFLNVNLKKKKVMNLVW